VLAELIKTIEPCESIADWGAAIVASTLRAARAELSADYPQLVTCLETISTAAPKAILVGDFSQLIYAVNMLYGYDS